MSRAELALIAVTAVWGATFLAVNAAMAFSAPIAFVGLRFGVAMMAAAALAPPVAADRAGLRFSRCNPIGRLGHD